MAREPVRKEKPAHKPGIKTTEFWMLVVLNILALLSSLFHHRTGTTVAQITDAGAVLNNLAYLYSRTLLKRLSDVESD